MGLIPGVKPVTRCVLEKTREEGFTLLLQMACLKSGFNDLLGMAKPSLAGDKISVTRVPLLDLNSFSIHGHLIRQIFLRIVSCLHCSMCISSYRCT